MDKNRAWLYCRVAHPDLEALELQKTGLTDYAKKHNFTIVGITAEHGSGLDFSRAGLRDVLVAAEDGDIDSVLITNLPRLGRDLQKTDSCIRWLEERGVSVVCMDGTVPQTCTDTLAGLMKASRCFFRADC